MRLKAFLLPATALLSAPLHILASQIPTPTASPTTATGSHLDDLIPSTTPFPGADNPNLDLRQNLGQVPNPVAPGAQVPPVTVYTIVEEKNGVGDTVVLTYTQIFERVPDQFPAARHGQIGYGTLHKKRAEEVEVPMTMTAKTSSGMSVVNTGLLVQTVVLALETVVITRPLRRATDVVVVETVTVGVSNQTAAGNGTALLGTGTRAPFMVTGVSQGLPSASVYAPSYGVHTHI